MWTGSLGPGSHFIPPAHAWQRTQSGPGTLRFSMQLPTTTDKWSTVCLVLTTPCRRQILETRLCLCFETNVARGLHRGFELEPLNNGWPIISICWGRNNLHHAEALCGDLSQGRRQLSFSQSFEEICLLYIWTCFWVRRINLLSEIFVIKQWLNTVFFKSVWTLFNEEKSNTIIK